MFKAFDTEIEKILERMLELANEGKEELGKRQPGEKCKFEEKMVYSEIPEGFAPRVTVDRP